MPGMEKLTVAQAIEVARTLVAGSQTGTSTGSSAGSGSGSGRRMLGITGPPGSGKSTLTAALAAALGESVAVVPMDGFHLAQTELKRLNRTERKGAPDTFDTAGFVAMLRRLRSADEPVVYAPLFRREIEEPIACALPVAGQVPLVIVEGNYLLLDHPDWRPVRSLLDECWFLTLDDDLRVERLVARHVAHGRHPDEAREWVLRSDEANALLVAAGRDRADRIVVL